MRKTVDFFSKSDDEKIKIAKSQIQETILKMISDAECEWEDWNAAGSIKRSQVIEEIYRKYPILSKVKDQTEFLNPLPGKVYGYSIAQWTSTNRKAGLYDSAKAKGVSIADEENCLEFLLTELNGSYKSVMSVLKNAKSVREASDIVLKKFEVPANMGTSVQEKRASYGQNYYNKYAKINGVSSLGGNTMTESELRRKVATWLDSYLGCAEGSAKHREILSIFNNSRLCTRYTMTVNDAWCATAVSAAFIACGLTSIFPCVECSCNNMITKAKNAGIWIENDAYIPKVGDVILYDWQDIQAVQRV